MSSENQEITAILPPTDGRCAECGRRVEIDLDGLIQYHDRLGLGGLCEGSKQAPAADSGSYSQQKETQPET